MNWNATAQLQLSYTSDELGTRSEGRYAKIHADDRVIDSILAAISGDNATWADDIVSAKKTIHTRPFSTAALLRATRPAKAIA